MSNRLIVIVTIIPLSEFLFHHFGVSALQAHGFEVEVWDCSEVFFPRVRHNAQIIRHHFSGLRLYQERTRLNEDLNHLRRTDIVIPWVSFARGYLWFFRGLAKTPAKIAVPIANPIPTSTPAFRLSKASRLIKLLKNPGNFIARLLDAVVGRLPVQVLGVRCADFLLLIGGNLTLQVGKRFLGKSTLLVWTHASDYDVILAQKLKSEIPKQIVFIDEYLPLHPDFELLNLPCPAQASTYYPVMKAVFEKLEEIHGLPVAIAAHPKADCKFLTKAFGGRVVQKGITANLIASSAFVIAHASTAINYAIILEKPVLILTTKEVQKSFFQKTIIDVAQAINTEVRLAEDLHVFAAYEPSVQKSKYETYFSNLIKNPTSPNVAIWDTISDVFLL